MVKPDIQNIQEENSGENDFLSLENAAKIYGYTQHHFGLLCRRGKLKSERIGKRWLTKKEWIDDYLKDVEAYYKNGNHHYVNGLEKVKIIVGAGQVEPEPQRILEFLPGRLVFKLAFAFSAMFFVMCSLGFDDSLKNFGARSARIANFFSSKINSVGTTADFKLAVFKQRTKNNADNFLAVVERAGNGLIDFDYNLNFAAIGSGDFQNRFFSGVSVFGRRTENNFFAFFNDIKSAGRSIRNFAYRAFDNIKQFAFAPEEAPAISTPGVFPPTPTPGVSELAEPAARDGLVVLPMDKNTDKDATVKMIKDSFSDEITVKPDEDGDSGIIQPIFKKGKGDEYIYVMVPVISN